MIDLATVIGKRGALPLVFAALVVASAQAQTGDDTVRLVVGTKEAPPFSFKDGDSWQGMSIELWEKVAADLGLEYELRELALEEILAGVEDGSLDAGVAAFTITAEREARLDFTHPFYISGLGIAVAQGDGLGALELVRGLFSLRLLRVLGGLLLLLFAVGALLWIFERRRNAEQFGGGAASGLGAAFWWSAVTMTTVGYGDKAPTTFGGRLVALVWMFTSVIIISGFTAAIASALTLQSLESRIRGPEDLPHVRVGGLEATTSADYLSRRGLSFQAYDSINDGLRAVADGEIDALVHDAPILRYTARRDFPRRLHVLDNTFQRQDYGIVLPDASPLREDVNSAMLARLREAWWLQVVARYLGD